MPSISFLHANGTTISRLDFFLGCLPTDNE
jgi:hypothetical protein